MAEESVEFTNLTKFYTMQLLSSGPRHGYEIMEELGRRLGRKPSPGQIYPLLKNFKRQGLITQRVVKTGDRSKKVYSLTEQGKSTAARMLRSFSDIVSVILEPKLTKCAHCGCKVYEGGYKEKIGGKLLMFCCVHCAGSYKKNISAT